MESKLQRILAREYGRRIIVVETKFTHFESSFAIEVRMRIDSSVWVVLLYKPIHLYFLNASIGTPLDHPTSSTN